MVEIEVEEKAEDILDATDSVLVYDQGKTVQCPNSECGKRHGLYKDAKYETCHFCSATFMDKKFDEREDEEPLEPGTKPDEIAESGPEESSAMEW